MDSICHNPLFLEGHCQNQLCCAFRSSASSVVFSVDVAFIAAFLEGIQSFSAYCKPVAVDRMADRRGRAWNRQNWHCQRWTGVRKVMASVTNADISTLSSLLSRILGPSVSSYPHCLCECRAIWTNEKMSSSRGALTTECPVHIFFDSKLYKGEIIFQFSSASCKYFAQNNIFCTSCRWRR